MPRPQYLKWYYFTFDYLGVSHRIPWKNKNVACIASVPVQSKQILVFRIRDAWKVGREQKGWRKGVGEGKEGNACLQTPQFWKTR